jgi:large subunit ribosomal protein L15
MPLQRRLPKIGFHSPRAKLRAEVRVHELAGLEADTVDLAALKRARLIPKEAEHAKVIASGTLQRAVKVVGVQVTAGARKIIEAAGGSVE